jgi:hypothetical protein
MDLQREGRQLALAFVNLDDIVFARELSANGINLLSFAGRSLVGSAVVGAGIATRAAVLGAQVATKSALAVAAVAKGRIPGAGVAEQVVYEFDRNVSHGGEAASFVASQGVAVARRQPKPPAEPIFGDPWLGKRLRPGATPNTVLMESALDLTRLAAMPLTFGTSALANALASPAGQPVMQSFWDALSAIVDSVGRRSSGRETTTADRSERRAVLVMIGVGTLMAAAQDLVEFGEALSRASAGDGARLRSALTKAIERIDAANGTSASTTATHTPSHLLNALDAKHDGETSRVATIGRAIVEDGASLSRLAVAYSSLLAGLVTSALQSTVSGALDVDTIEAWVRADEQSRAGGGRGVPETCPASVKQLETLVAAFGRTRADGRRRGFLAPATVDLACDTIFIYSVRALGRELALARMERLFGAAVRQRLADDCSLRSEILDAKGDRDRRLAALVSQLRGEGSGRLRDARDHAAERLASLSADSVDGMLERLVPQRIGDRIAVLQRFVGLADMTNALDGVPAADESRQKVAAKFTEWIATAAAPERRAQA